MPFKLETYDGVFINGIHNNGTGELCSVKYFDKKEDILNLEYLNVDIFGNEINEKFDNMGVMVILSYGGMTTLKMTEISKNEPFHVIKSQ